jgi:hypothetical protein
MRPFRIFLLLCTVFLFLGLLSFVTPVNGIRLGNGFTLRIPSVTRFFYPPEKKYADITQLAKNDKSDSVIAINPFTPVIRRDTLPHPTVRQLLEYPDSTKRTLDHFFFRLAGIHESGECLHILHYGDSQLESDRITDYLRFRFQDEFGGNGPGLVTPGEEIYRPSIRISNSGNWSCYSLVGTLHKNQLARSYGGLACFTRFAPLKDTGVLSSLTREAWIRISRQVRAARKPLQYGRCRIFYANNRSLVILNFLNGEQQFKSDTLLPATSFTAKECDFFNTPEDLTIRLRGEDSPDFFGLCLDEKTGVSVDNIALRGSSGLEFTRMDPEILTGMLQQLNAGMLILQFGVNAIPGNLSDYTYYENALYRQLTYLKKLVPELAIVVIGVSDASQKTGEEYETYPSVEKIVAAQRTAALRAGCVFWNLYEAMGGRNSMPSWVFAKEPLATTDFLHFNYTGARIVSKMFYSALIQEYNDFLTKRR